MFRAPPRVLRRSLAPSGVLGGGAVRSRFPPTWLGVVGVAAGLPRGGAFYRCVGRLGSCAPPPPTARPLGGLSGSAIHVLWARACGCGGPALSVWGLRAAGRVRGVHMLGGGLGGGGVRRTPRLCGRGGACRAGGRSASFRPSAFPGQATKRASLALCCPWGAGPPYHSGSCSPGFSGYDLCGVLSRRRGLACSLVMKLKLPQIFGVPLSLELGKAATDLKPCTQCGHWPMLGMSIPCASNLGPLQFH